MREFKNTVPKGDRVQQCDAVVSVAAVVHSPASRTPEGPIKKHSTSTSDGSDDIDTVINFETRTGQNSS